MKRLVLLILILFSVNVSFAQVKEQLSEKEKARREKNIQAGNPFKRFGYKPKIATLSKGKYLEFHDLDTIMRIGSFVFNTRQKKITGYVNLDTVHSEATLNPQLISRWLSPDPLCEEFPSWSPYNFTMNNPIRFFDPDGKAPEEIIIRGKKSKQVFKQLNASTSLRLKIDDNGKISAKGKAKTKADKVLLAAINSETVQININATDSNFTDDGHWFVGGAFEGNTVDNDGKTIAKQTINPDMTKKIDKFYEVDYGVSVMHEVLEAYIAAVETPGTNKVTFDDVKNKTQNAQNYLNAHNKAKQIDPRHVSPIISRDPNTGHLYINKPHPIIPQLNIELEINDLSK